METEVSAERYYPAVLTAAPVLLTIPGATNQAAILKAGTAQLVSSSNPASSSDVLEIYCTGLADGSVIPPQVTIGGRMAQVLWFGKAPGIAGLNQVNVRVPEGVPGGAAVPVRLHYLGRLSNSATIGLR